MDEYRVELIKKAQKGDKIALDKLIKNEQGTIKTMLYYLNKNSNDVVDLAQEILLKISKNIKQLKSPLAFKTWVNQIVINAYYDNLRKKKKDNQIITINTSDAKLFEIADNASNPQDSLLNDELDKVIKKSINNLPSQYKIPIALREIQGLSYDEISNITNSTIGTVKSRIARARAKIKSDILKYSRA
ncbi:MAG: sigma-70 family RNA polymerase sigma factor [Candidatus Gastranaerophilales bacterium]|nr:sigma-70 family RNA polymerase sigma factor [Candidatus Gastranaerophilales bacterium]